jgi:group I intron endonuclease
MEKKLTIENTRGLVDPCIYMLTAPSGKIYVGSALNGFHERSIAYRNENAHGVIDNALKKYGASSFTFSILESSKDWQKDKLQEREQHYMDTLQPFGTRGYNIERVAGVVEAPTRLVSQFTRTGEPVASYESITWAGVMARAHKSSVNECASGKIPSAGGFIWLYSEDVNEQEIALRVKIAASVTSSDKRRVSQYTKAGEFVACFGSISEAARATSGNIGNISACAKGKKPSAGGFIWVYFKEVTQQEIARRVQQAASVSSINKRPVSQYTKAGVFVASFESTSAAARVTGVNVGNITTCCKGKRKTAGGFIWKYT